MMSTESVIDELTAAFCRDDATTVHSILDAHSALKARINEPVGPFDSPVITQVRSRQMLDVLLAAGADINVKSRWWAGGFGLLHSASPELAAYAIERGATVDAYAAARLGLMTALRDLVAADAAVVHARGGDGQMPLHFAATVEVARFLLDHGADIDARDVDHESTAAQYMLDGRQEVARFLIEQGCATDILMAAALGDTQLAQMHLDADPDSIHMRVSDEYFPMVGGKNGGTIYQWNLGWYVSAHQVARKFGHEALFRFLMDRSPNEVRLVTACWLGDKAMVQALLAKEPDLAGRLNAADRRQLAHAARNNDLAAVESLLMSGFPIDVRSQHGASPLHWAAFHGNRKMVELILRGKPALETTDSDFHSTPLGWAIYGSEHGWDRATGDYAATVRALMTGGAKPPDKPAGSSAVRAALAEQRA